MSGGAGRLTVGVLGELRVRRGDADVPVPGARLRGLVVRLASAGGRPVTAGALSAALWPGDGPADPANALHSLVSRLRRLLGGGDTVAQADGGYRLAIGPDDVDAGRFERLAAQGRERLRAGDPAAAAAALTEAVALIRGPVAVEVAEVAPAYATRLTQTVAETGADLAEAELALGEPGRAAGRLTALLADHPLSERLTALLIDALDGLGRQADALAAYERLRERLADRFGTDPGAALRERHLRLLRGVPGPAGADGSGGDGASGVPQPREAPAPRTVRGTRERAAQPPTNLPAAVTSFVGREDDLARVDALLTAGRLVTVLGPGGAGKTRLALEAAWRRAGEYRDGTWLVDLTSVTEAAKVGAAVVAAAGLRGSALFETVTRAAPDGRDDVDVLAGRLTGRDMLLVVDNCEHLVDAVAHLVNALLARCPRLRILATSREPLAIDGEALVPLGPLGLPGTGAAPADVERSPAVRLFTERAAAVRPGFRVDDRTCGDIVQVVRGLDGLPLALELAAARLRTLGLPELAAGLSDRFRLLTTGTRTAQPRHRTLRAVIAWSWDLLSGPERSLAERIAVYPGGVDVASAEAVGDGAGDTADLLAALVDRSLLHLAPDGRYRMLETLREYGIERLAEQGLLDAVRDRAARRLAAFVAVQDPLLRTAGQLTALRMMRAEYDNALAALRHFCDSGDARSAIALALNLCWYWQMFGRNADAGYWLGAALAVPGERDPVAADCAEVVLALNHGDPSPPEQTQSRMRALSQRIAGYPVLPGPAGAIAAVTLYFAGERELADQRLGRFIDGPDPWLAALSYMFRAQIAENDGDLEALGVNVAAALDGFRAIGDRWGQATVLPLRALRRQYEGDLDGAVADLRTARALAAEFGSLDIGDEIFIDLRWADLHMRRGESDEAMAALASARARADRSASRELKLLVDALEAGIVLWTGELHRAVELIERAAAGLNVDGHETPMAGGDHGCAIVGAIRAAVAVRQGDPDAAERAIAMAYPAAVQTRDSPILAMVAVAAGGVAAARGQAREAAALLGAAARLRGAHDHTDLNVAAVSAQAREMLGEKGFGEAYAAGWSLERQAARSLVDPARRALPQARLA
ncbi:AfsR/SARP family transcriptional regulator [Actinoplanes utahensis]|uniref:SARP family transcriptional regulator n=1 Tax=Actinoplanes utahensis TaxID=1869 RepID=A0A0A6ULU6_ACTUT|nr:BTAD domain-containing putative transcriptional regulator [Actinoplanes utahensis]KHD76386.1 SARP family transcriptional regulator [Actinoplanes utahensis]GIF29844.1 SARP family transcriptional regulator [Actinoplanes utahensis]